MKKLTIQKYVLAENTIEIKEILDLLLSKKNVTSLIKYMEFKLIINKENERAKTNEELNQYINNNPLLQNLFAMPMLEKKKVEDYDYNENDKSDVKLKGLMQKFYVLNNGLDEMKEFGEDWKDEH